MIRTTRNNGPLRCATRVMALLLALVPSAVIVRPARAADVAVSATVDRTQVAVGDSIMLSIDISGTQRAPAPDLGDLGGLQAQYLGPSTQVSIINTQMSASVSHRYALTARQAGRVTLGPFQVEYEGKQLATQPITVEVVAQAQGARGGAPGAPGGTELRLVATAAKTDAYVGERIPLTVKLFVGNVRVDNLQFPKIAGEGFSVEPPPQPAQQEEVVHGRRYRTLTFQTTLTALRSGPLTVGPVSMGMNVYSRRRGGAFGNAFFDDVFAEASPHEEQAEPLSLTVHALPEAGRPADFGGAVGRFDFGLEAKPTDLNAGDPITVRMRISGEGNLGTVPAPKIPVDDRFRTYDAQVAKDEDGKGARTFEQVLIPKVAGISELPAVRFSYFDPAAGRYQTVTRGPVPLTVRAAAAVEGPKVIGAQPAGAPDRPAEKLGRDIVYIKDAPGTFHPRQAVFYRTWWWLALQTVPVAGFAGLSWFVRRRDRLAADPRRLRFRQAGREARRALTALAQGSADGTKFYDQLTAAVHAYLGAKLDLPPGAIERERVLARLGADVSPAEVRQRVQAFFDLVEGARYAGTAGAALEREQALALAREVVDRLERDRGVTSRFAAGALLSLIVVLATGARLPAAAPPGDADGDPHTAFYEGNAAYKDGRYADAVRAYERVRAAGVESGALYFNLANAYFKTQQTGQAILNYERARRWLPRDPDVRANLAYAQEVAQDPIEEASWWYRLFFPLASRATSGELAGLAAALWSGFWLLLTGRALGTSVRPGMERAAWVTAVLWACVTASLGARVQQFELSRSAVVTAAGPTAVRFEPSPGGTEYFKVNEGVLVDVTDRREGWLQIRRRDGRRGWVPLDAVTEVGAG